MTFEQALQALLTINPLAVVKLCFVVGMVLYTVFAYVMVRQEQLMSQVVFMQANSKIRALTIIHLATAILVLLLAIVIL